MQPRKIALILCLCLTCLLVPINAQGAPSPYRWAYMLPDSSDPNTFQFYAVNLNGPDNFLFSIQSNFVSHQGYPSPDGNWIVLGYGATISYRADGLLRLVNVRTGEIRVVGPVAGIDGDRADMESPLEVYWSPDSRYFAFSSGNRPSQIHLSIFDVQKGLAKEISVDDGHDFMAWANDSKHLAVQATRCQNNICQSTFDLYGTDALIASVPFAPAGTYPKSSAGRTACKMAWSPDDKVISFVWQCDVTSFVPNDVYLLDVQTQRILPVTHMQKELGNYDMQVGQAPVWISADTLLIGTWGWQMLVPLSDTDTPVPKTISRTTQFPGEQIVFDKAVKAWWSNPTSGRIAYQFASDDSGQLDNPIHLGTIEHGAIVEKAATSLHGNLFWSPDGSQLAVMYNDLNFVNPDTGKATPHTLPLQMYNVGWIAYP